MCVTYINCLWFHSFTGRPTRQINRHIGVVFSFPLNRNCTHIHVGKTWAVGMSSDLIIAMLLTQCATNWEIRENGMSYNCKHNILAVDIESHLLRRRHFCGLFRQVRMKILFIRIVLTRRSWMPSEGEGEIKNFFVKQISAFIHFFRKTSFRYPKHCHDYSEAAVVIPNARGLYFN